MRWSAAEGVAPQQPTSAAFLFVGRRHLPGRLAGLSFVLQAVALAADLHDVGVMQQPIQHGRRQRLVPGEGRGFNCVNGRLLVSTIEPRS